MIKIMLIEDNAAYRKSIGWALEQADDMELTHQFGTASVALRKVSTFTDDGAPNVILLDLNLPGISGLDALPQLRILLPQAKVIILTQSDMQEDVLRAIEQGAAGYVLKSSSIPQLMEGIQTVHNGGATLDPELAGLIMNTLKKRSSKTEPATKLSKRELEVLTHIADGAVQKQIADQLGISSYTVNEYIAGIYRKLNVHNAPAAVAKAYQTGVLP
ncbi:response regulator transcription factor [Pontiellaceae bacterium B1224]|nr:response regulator transcription factor [Pontiellaceae bacterium B1224]